MPIATLTSRELNQDVGRAKTAAPNGPVFITDRGRPAHVLLTVEDDRALLGEQRTLADAVAMEGLSEIDFDPPRIDLASASAALG